CCPACGDLGLQRQRTKRLLMELERENPGVKQSMLKALGNVAPRHLLDTRLNPPDALRADVPLPPPLSALRRASPERSEGGKPDTTEMVRRREVRLKPDATGILRLKPDTEDDRLLTSVVSGFSRTK